MKLTHARRVLDSSPCLSHVRALFLKTFFRMTHPIIRKVDELNLKEIFNIIGIQGFYLVHVLGMYLATLMLP